MELLVKMASEISKHASEPFAKLNTSSVPIAGGHKKKKRSKTLPTYSSNQEQMDAPDLYFKFQTNGAQLSLVCEYKDDEQLPSKERIVILNLGELEIDLMSFHHSHSSQTIQFKFSTDDSFTLQELDSSPSSPSMTNNNQQQPRTMIQKCTFLVKPYQQNASHSIQIHLTSKSNPYEKTTINHLNVSMNGFYVNLYLDQPTSHHTLVLLSNFFESNQETIGIMTTSLQINIRDSCFDYNPIHVPSRLLITMDSLSIQTIIPFVSCGNDVHNQLSYVLPSESHLSFELVGFNILLHDQIKSDLIELFTITKSYKSKPILYSEFGFLNQLKNVDFVQIVSMGGLKASIKSIVNGGVSTKEKPPLLIQLSDTNVIISFCDDSLVILMQLLRYVSSSGDLPPHLKPIVPIVNQHVGVTTTTTQQSSFDQQDDDDDDGYEEYTSKEYSIYPNYKQLENDDQEELKTSTDEDHTPTTTTTTSTGGKLIFSNLILDYMPSDTNTTTTNPSSTTNTTSSNRKNKEFNSEQEISIKKFDHYERSISQRMESYFPLFITEEESITRILPNEYPIPSFEFIMNQDVDLTVELYGGSDFNQSSKRDHNKSVRLLFKNCFVQYHTFSSTVYESRLRINFEQVEMIDKLKISNRNKIISEWKSESFPHEDSSRMFDLVIERVKSTTDQQESNSSSSPHLRITFQMLPIRLNLHQETVMFLMSFAKAIDSPSHEHDSSPSDYQFRSVRFSPIHFKIDYQPTSVINSLSRIKDGRYFDLLNLTSINGVEIGFEEMEFHEQSGISNLVSEITKKMIPQISGTRVFRILLGIMPIRSMYNVGSGVADLIVLPIQQYHRDGQILRGLRRGVASFVSNVGVEAVQLSATGFQVSNYALQSVGDMLSSSGGGNNQVDDYDDEYNRHRQQHQQQQASGNHGGGEPMSPASNLNAGLQKAYHEIEKGLSNAKCAIIAIPREYDRSGSGGAALSVMRAMIVTPSRALQGATGAVTQMLYGLLSEINPSSTENESLYKM
ncbi:autophagy-related protein ATG2 [Acrasis kona]|uniref:Autophagy-related protein 2 n=1 Tax=Acrasis kona TaxID=1008807 RepID=A0AAW2YI83_9EUKA